MVMDNKACLTGLAVAGALLLGSLPAKADETTDALLQELQAKGILSAQDVDSLKAKAAKVAAAKAAAAPPAPIAAAPGTLSVADSAGFVKMMDKGVGVHLGAVDVKISGEINAFYAYDSAVKPGPTTTVGGGLASVGSSNTSSVRSGLLPGDLNLDITTTQDGIDVGAHFGLYPGINSAGVGALNANNGGHPTGLSTAGVDFRQEYVTVGTADFGTFKAGRDIGLFGQEAILNDMTLFGVGTPSGNAAPGNTSLGRIGLGYIYTDWEPQLTYTSPSFDGFKVAVAVMQPLDGLDFSGTPESPATSNGGPQFQAKIAYNGAFEDWKIKLWANTVVQDYRVFNTAFKARSVTGYAFDFGGNVDYGPFSGMAYGYTGSGIGTTALLFDAVSIDGRPRDSSGFIVQGMYTLGKFTLGGSYGVSYLDLASGEVNPLLVKSNASEVGQIRYQLTSWDTMVAEYIHTDSQAHGGNSAYDDAFALGTIVFF